MTRAWKLVVPALLGGLLLGAWIGSRCERAAMRRLRREGPNPEKALKTFRRELSLSDAQTESVRGILLSRRERFAGIRRDGHERFRVLRAEMDAEIEKTLDDAQKKKFAELRARWDKKHADGGPHAPR